MTDSVMHLFDGFNAEDAATALTAVPPDVKEDEIDENESPSYDPEGPKCRTCGGPNFSLEKDQCIVCRIGFC